MQQLFGNLVHWLHSIMTFDWNDLLWLIRAIWVFHFNNLLHVGNIISPHDYVVSAYSNLDLILTIVLKDRVWMYSFLSCKNLVSHLCPCWGMGILVSTFISTLVVSQIFTKKIFTKKKSHQGGHVRGTHFLFFNVQCQGRNDNCINLKIDYQITIA